MQRNPTINCNVIITNDFNLCYKIRTLKGVKFVLKKQTEKEQS